MIWAPRRIQKRATMAPRWPQDHSKPPKSTPRPPQDRSWLFLAALGPLLGCSGPLSVRSERVHVRVHVHARVCMCVCVRMRVRARRLGG